MAMERSIARIACKITRLYIIPEIRENARGMSDFFLQRTKQAVFSIEKYNMKALNSLFYVAPFLHLPGNTT